MKSRTIRVLLVLTLTFMLLGFYSQPAHAASCYGSTCENLDPNTMGCGTDAITSGARKYLTDGGTNLSYAETRKSAACAAKWARTTNASGAYRYAAATIRYGCANYCYAKNVSSPASIANNAVVYTPMMNNYYNTPTRSCGALGTSQIYVPLSLSDNWCTGAN
jgi:hypothetical protein